MSEQFEEIAGMRIVLDPDMPIDRMEIRSETSLARAVNIGGQGIAAVNAALQGGPADGRIVALPVDRYGNPPEMYEAIAIPEEYRFAVVAEVPGARRHYYYRRPGQPVGGAPWEYGYCPTANS